MSQLLNIENFGSNNILGTTSLNVDYVSGTSLTPKNTSGIASQLFLLVGRPGDDGSELGQVASVSGGVVTLQTALAYAHSKYAEILVLGYNQIKVYRAANVGGSIPLDGSFSSLATVGIDANDLTTQYNDTSGGSNYWYKFTYFNSVSSAESDIANTTAIRGGLTTYYTSLYAIRKEAGMLNNRYISDVDVSIYRARAQSYLDSKISDRYTVPLPYPVPAFAENITAKVAAAYLLQADYGPTAQGSSKDGAAKQAEADTMITSLQTGDTELLSATGASTVLDTGIAGWPDDTTYQQPEFDDTGTPTAGGGSIFNIKHKF